MVDRNRLPEFFAGPILVAGAGVSGAGMAHLLMDLHADVTVADDDEIRRDRVTEATGAHAITVSDAIDQLSRFRVVVTSPGWNPQTALLVTAAELGIPVLGDVELAWQIDQSGAFGPPRMWIAITGTNGKTTTTAMVAAMLTSLDPEAPHAVAVGNIGLAVGEALTQMNPRAEILVAELSSFQLYWSSTLHPHVGTVLNLADDHIDWHGSFTAYADAKAKVLNADIALVNRDDPRVVAYAPESLSYTLAPPQPGEVGVRDGFIVDRAFAGEDYPDGEPIAPIDSISPPGIAGLSDAVAATAVARAIGTPAAQIARALRHFTVAVHRGGVVWESQSLSFVDNSKATNPHAAHTVLQGLDHYVWIGGGQLKGADVTDLISEHGPHMRAAVLMGVDRHVLADAFARLSPTTPVEIVDTTDGVAAMEEVVACAVDYAQPGDRIVLAPAGASLDMYAGMSERGNLFAQAARALVPLPAEGS
ncbi:MAG: UDP-N-acetylmuramoyl-L-alanine--D-glutamate ligase [Corynebacterium sp.]|nr:UDP-N-acetylmuramoyl-L-alanine--D-glutamate ligase [Corynebacterium sp.]